MIRDRIKITLWRLSNKTTCPFCKKELTEKYWRYFECRTKNCKFHKTKCLLEKII